MKYRLLLGGLLLSPVAHAEELGVLGYDARTSAVAGASIARGSSPGVAYTNPALLSAAPTQVSGGLLVFRSLVTVESMPSRNGVPRSVYDSTLGITPGLDTRPLPAAELASARGSTQIDEVDYRVGMGGVVRWGRDRFAAGIILGLPVLGGDRANISTHYADEREANFSNRVWPLRLGGWQRVADAVAGFAWQATPWLSVGVAGQVEAVTVARISVYVPDASVQDQVSSSATTSVSTSVRPILGVQAKIVEKKKHALSVGAVFRGASYFEVDAESQVVLWNYHESNADSTKLKRSSQRIPIFFGYRPLELGLGVGGRTGAFEAELTLTWQRWSAYLDQHGERPQQAASFPRGYASSPVDTGRFAFQNVFVPALGGRWRAASWAEVSAGVSFQPTPVPAQVGRTNYADSDLWGITLGERWKSGDWSLDTTFQFWMYAPRTTYKDPSMIVDEVPDSVRSLSGGGKMPEMEGLQSNNPGFPGYTLRGAVLAGSLFLTRTF